MKLTRLKSRAKSSIAIMIVATVGVAPLSAKEPGEPISTLNSESYLSESEASIPIIDSSYTLDDYLALAAKNSPALRSAFYEWRAAVENSGHAGALPDPVFSYSYFVENVETRVGPQNQKLGLRQSIPWIGTLGAKKEIASETAKAAERRIESERFRLLYQVQAAYYEYYYLGQDISITEANLELLKLWESVARTRYKTALAGHPDVIKAQVELGLLEDRLLTLRDQIGPAAARLRSAVNIPDSVTLPLPPAVATPGPELNDAAVVRAVQDYSPDLQSLQHMVAKEEAGVRLAKKASWPGFTFGVDYIETGEALDPAMLDSGKDPWAVGVSVSLPLWFGKNKARRQEAAARRNQAEYRLLDARNQLTARAHQALFKYNDALRKIKLYRDGLIPKAEQSVNTSYTAYQAGELEFLSLLEAQRQLLEFERRYQRAVADLGIGRGEIEMLTGKQISELIR